MEALFETIHPALSVISAFLAVSSMIVGYFALRRGLTYDMTAATTAIAIAFALGRSWHVVYELLHFDAGELFEYLIYFSGYIAFWVLAYRVSELGLFARRPSK